MGQGVGGFGIAYSTYGIVYFLPQIVKQFGLTTVVTLQDDRIRNMADGEIFNTITHGKNTMMPYGPRVIVQDRWAIICYLRAT